MLKEVDKEFRILWVEDVVADMVMINHVLRESGLRFRSRRVEDKEAFLDELERNTPDLILSDQGLPSFDSFTALALAREKCPEVPFILVTGCADRKKLSEAIERGATDCVLKDDPQKAVRVVRRSLRKSGEQRTLRQK